MIKTNDKKKPYFSPRAEVMETRARKVICGSGAPLSVQQLSSYSGTSWD